jgi:hypothetical protein
MIEERRMYMKFLYFLDNSAGWAGISFEYENISLNYSVSYCMGENIRQLLAGLLTLTGHKNDTRVYYDANEYSYDEVNSFKWKVDEEGSNVNFIFEKTNNQKIINLQIVEINDEETKSVFNKDINFQELIDCVLYSCSEILNKYGILGYYLNFWEEFPISNYLMLQDFKHNKIKFDSFNETNNNREQNMERTSIVDEIKYIFDKEKPPCPPWQGAS